jgi:hypothetical protein
VDGATPHRRRPGQRGQHFSCQAGRERPQITVVACDRLVTRSTICQ